MKHSSRIARARGFTLIELMIAVAVLAIIIGIAIPSFTQYVLEAGRSDAKNALMQGAQAMERCYTRFSVYNDGQCTATGPEADGGIDGSESENEKYEVTITGIGENTFELTATPIGGQLKDADCTSFSLTHTGQKGANGGTDAADIEECW